ncbi:MAG: SusD/RagB family nutrient-binding outer membrane lipoprotein [Taibaiella sp.]|jgi:hypothetical protein
MNRLIYLLTLICWLITAGCTKNFDEIQKNPNDVQGATPGSFLAPVLYDITVTNLSRAHRIGNELMQYSVHKGDGIEFHRYYVSPTESDYIWDRHYSTAYNIQDMYNRAIEYKDSNFVAVALTLKAYVCSQLTDIYGDIPYSEAFMGDQGNLTPVYDQQESIYKSLMAGLDSAAKLFGTGKLAYGNDILYNGDIEKWKKFCNSLRLRLYLRLSKRSEMHSAEKIAEIVSSQIKYPVFGSDDDEAILKFTGVEPFFNPFYNARDLDFGNAKAPSKFIIDLLVNIADPRLPVWYAKANGDYIPVVSGYGRYKNGATFASSTSYIQNNLKSSPLLGTILSYAEVCFILSEAAQKGWISGDAKSFYEEGVKSSMKHWGVTPPETYLTQPGVVYDGQLSTIILQKYLAQWFVGLESWFEFRRTGYPQLPVNPEALNDGKMPVRLLYPTSTQLLNNSHYHEAIDRIGGDNCNSKGWWEK